MYDERPTNNHPFLGGFIAGLLLMLLCRDERTARRIVIGFTVFGVIGLASLCALSRWDNQRRRDEWNRFFAAEAAKVPPPNDTVFTPYGSYQASQVRQFSQASSLR